MTGSSDIGMLGSSSLTEISRLTTPGNVSYVLPTLHTMFGIPAPDGSFPHHPTFASAAGTDEAHEEAVVVGKSLALIGWEMLTDHQLYDKAKAQWEDSIRE